MKKNSRRAIFTLSQKGGAGKSTFSRALLDHLRIQRGMPVAAFDTDGQVGQLLQYYGQRDSQGQLINPQSPFDGVLSFDLHQSEQRDLVVDALDLKADTMLFDFPAGPLDYLVDVLGTGNGILPLVEEYKKEGFRITVAVVISNIQASAFNIISAMDVFQDYADGPSGFSVGR